MNYNVLIKVLGATQEQYDWLEVDLDTCKFSEGNSVTKSHSNYYNLAVCVSTEEYQKVKRCLEQFNVTLYGIAN
ncbi:hypothetical protein APW19_14020 [Staphylococcus aureus]|uniref:hypothetical protein n=1 Tax=Staphylococcus TaxID=1279 RepID=UPI000BA55787|nr:MULTISPECIES: hypothetical protein [Staphylococcus]MBM9733132.1 hypothetical protein [Staphylococcus aureus]MCE5132228.1 hypothetical protein [Staphylococcus saprophyticus]MDK7754174.1 hypothetical protein [Staphylococcus sp. UMB10092B]PAJ44072.1 hypothetical protein APW19_12385 [Staphylococcus aureus]PAJ48947.1 hypothetical protein APW19_14020 [Staphylococcus aureus]